jgi:hypothetical protein
MSTVRLYTTATSVFFAIYGTVGHIYYVGTGGVVCSRDVLGQYRPGWCYPVYKHVLPGTRMIGITFVEYPGIIGYVHTAGSGGNSSPSPSPSHSQQHCSSLLLCTLTAKMAAAQLQIAEMQAQIALLATTPTADSLVVTGSVTASSFVCSADPDPL